MNNGHINKELFLDEDTIIKMREMLTDRVAIIVIQAIYTVTDAAYDYPSRHAINSLIPAAIYLKESASTGRIGFIDIQPIALILDEAETLLRATRQRLSGLPQTREASRLPFELPPSSVKIYIESCEFVVHSLLEMFNDQSFIPNYVIIDTVDSPKLSLLALRMPEHRLKQLAVYLPLSHEAFHGFIYNFFTEFMNKNAIVRNFIESGKIISYITPPQGKVKIVSELLVEILDYEFSYLGNLERYMEEEWLFFYQYIVGGSPKLELESLNVIHYFLRTFSTRLWQYLKKNGYGSFISSSKFRTLIRQHADDIRLILRNDFVYFENIISPTLILMIQKDFEENYDVFMAIFTKICEILTKYESLLEKLHQYFRSQELDRLTEIITKGEVTNEIILYPHLLIQSIAKRLKENSSSPQERLKIENCIIIPMIMSLWNSKNKKNHMNNNPE